MSVICYAYDQEREQKLWQRWILHYQDQMSFEDFKLQLKPIPQKKEEEVLEDVAQIIGMVGG